MKMIIKYNMKYKLLVLDLDDFVHEIRPRQTNV